MINLMLGLGMSLVFASGICLGWMMGYYLTDKPKKKSTGFHSKDPVCPHALYYDDCPLCRH